MTLERAQNVAWALKPGIERLAASAAVTQQKAADAILSAVSNSPRKTIVLHNTKPS